MSARSGLSPPRASEGARHCAAASTRSARAFVTHSSFCFPSDHRRKDRSPRPPRPLRDDGTASDGAEPARGREGLATSGATLISVCSHARLARRPVPRRSSPPVVSPGVSGGGRLDGARDALQMQRCVATPARGARPSALPPPSPPSCCSLCCWQWLALCLCLRSFCRYCLSRRASSLRRIAVRRRVVAACRRESAEVMR